MPDVAVGCCKGKWLEVQGKPERESLQKKIAVSAIRHIQQ